MGTTALRFGIGLLIVGLCIFAWMLAQGIGTAFGHGLQEWLVR